MLNYLLCKMKGSNQPCQMASLSEIFWSWVGGFLGILAVALIHEKTLSSSSAFLVVGSFGASAVLIYGAIKSPLAQPRNLIGGHVISALVGVTCYKLFPSELWLAAPLAVSVSIALMHLTLTLHPPGGATALIAVIGDAKIHALGYAYAFVPIAAGAAVMLLIALVVNNIPKSRQYPTSWV